MTDGNVDMTYDSLPRSSICATAEGEWTETITIINSDSCDVP